MVGLVALCFYADGRAQTLPPGVERKTIQSGASLQSYVLYVPERRGETGLMPLLVVMHGAGGNGLEQVQAWLPLAAAESVILLGPNIENSARVWDQLYDHPEWIRGAIDQTAREHHVDSRRLYLWGYSAGGMFSFYLAFLESRYFAAAAVHGGVIENFKYQMADFARRKIPLAYYIGTRDQWWSVQQTRASRDALVSRGFPVHYVELEGADHNFHARSGEITRDAWSYMSRLSLEAAPQFDPLDLPKIKAALK